MGLFDYLSDLYTSATFQPAEAEERQNAGPEDTSGEQSRGTDVNSGGVGTAQHDRGAGVKGGASDSLAHSGTDEESDDEKDANAETADKAKSRTAGEGEKGHVPGEGGASSGQKGKDASGPHGGSVKQTGLGGDGGGEEEEAGRDDEPEAEGEEEEEDEDDEPVDPKAKLEEDCLRTSQCAPLKHHYDECAERVQQQQEEHGKAEEDCVEEFFHMMHCASACAAPKLFRQLK
ncbi:hypothetical protein B0A48_01448 [Cryoendolithus antarcticus]|uniref:Cytochrome b-c1 complex subunit 6, mitochondrial n=1 Tax=Cryoendolithus antarcticus TaxID=1507870 RepID=A0A1V8TPD1_9PEZI|nr:hypothetical protein B0A48_01448 [Cryoendolithus antarcticus]